MFKKQAAKKSVTLVTKTRGNACDRAMAYANMQREKSAERLPYLFGDKRFLQQVLFNIVSNAIGHAPEGSKVHIFASYEAELLRVEIIDQGKGLDKGEI